MDLAKELEKLERMRKRGALTEKEFKRAKEALLNQTEPLTKKVSSTLSEVSSDPNVWPMLIHFSQFCGYLLPLAGLIVPIVLWQVMKNESAAIDRHGRVVANWVVSELIYYAVAALLSFIIIGIPLAVAVGIIGLIFPIIGGVKASKGELWEYPLSIKFFPVDPEGGSPFEEPRTDPAP